MCVRDIFEKGTFTPSDLNRLQEAFDLAWSEVESGVCQTEHEKLREMLATIIVATANVPGLDKANLSSIAIRSFKAVRGGNLSLL